MLVQPHRIKDGGQCNAREVCQTSPHYDESEPRQDQPELSAEGMIVTKVVHVPWQVCSLGVDLGWRQWPNHDISDSRFHQIVRGIGKQNSHLFA